MSNLIKTNKEKQNNYEQGLEEESGIDIPYKKEDIDSIVKHRPTTFLRNSLKKVKVKKQYPDALSVL